MEIAHPSNSWIDQKFFCLLDAQQSEFVIFNYLIYLLMFINIKFKAVPHATWLLKLPKVNTKIWAFK